MGRSVVVAGVDGDDGKNILVVVCLQPDEAYASKNQKHIGFIRDGKLIPEPKGEPASQRETTAIESAYAALRVAILAIEPLKG